MALALVTYPKIYNRKAGIMLIHEIILLALYALFAVGVLAFWIDCAIADITRRNNRRINR